MKEYSILLIAPELEPHHHFLGRSYSSVEDTVSIFYTHLTGRIGFIREIIIIIIIIILLFLEFLTSVGADSFPLEFERQQVSSVLQDSSQYSSHF